MFLIVHGRPEESEEHKTEQWMDNYMIFAILAGCTVVSLDALRHVLAGFFFVFSLAPYRRDFLVILARLWIWDPRATGGRQEAHPGAK